MDALVLIIVLWLIARNNKPKPVEEPETLIWIPCKLCTDPWDCASWKCCMNRGRPL